MSTTSFAMRDSATMFRRNVRHALRNPGTMIMSFAVPVMMLLLFVGVLGGTLNVGLGDRAHGDSYVDYVVPAILLMTVGYGATTTALSLNRDMTEGIISRFRTMAISRASVLTGHVLAAVVRGMISIAVVIIAALLIGFRPVAGVGGWLGMIGISALLVLAQSWLAVAIGLMARNADGVSPFTLLVQILPFLSSAFVPPDSMSGAVRWFAENEPFSPIADTMRGLLLGIPIGNSGILAAAWCVGLALAGYLWARALFRRDPAR